MKRIKEILFQQIPPKRTNKRMNLWNKRSSAKGRKRTRIAIKRKLRSAMTAPALPHMTVELYAEQAQEVTVFRYFGHQNTGYAVCPNCGYAMEREYQKHCEQCGQLLGWKRFLRNEITVQRIIGPPPLPVDAIRGK